MPPCSWCWLVLVHFVLVINTAEIGWKRRRMLFCLIKIKYILSIEEVNRKQAIDWGAGGWSYNFRREFKVWHWMPLASSPKCDILNCVLDVYTQTHTHTHAHTCIHTYTCLCLCTDM